MWKPNQTIAQPHESAIDAGLRSFMLSVYNYMGGGLALTGIMALLFASNEALLQLVYRVEGGMIVGMTGLGWLVAFAPVGFALFFEFRMHSVSFRTIQMLFWIFAGIMGISLSTLLLMYTGASVARVFFITAGLFGGMSLYGYTTKRDLTGLGAFLIMGLWGVFIASIVNIWMKSSATFYALSVVSVFIFIGLTAYDTQRLKGIYYEVAGSGEAIGKAAIKGAFRLYMDFINLFIHLLRLMGDRR